MGTEQWKQIFDPAAEWFIVIELPGLIPTLFCKTMACNHGSEVCISWLVASGLSHTAQVVTFTQDKLGRWVSSPYRPAATYSLQRLLWLYLGGSPPRGEEEEQPPVLLKTWDFGGQREYYVAGRWCWGGWEPGAVILLTWLGHK